ncbi:hypothetical protein COV12_03150 [Candidatus Woesearchaeota archaeon CG10_big_fil_rev_8_21_14_0_10_32_24]|nr:MAG: hypothetical protein COV12_03150 [Candidatus Woesearchaeota archaeon CG10_big_fil_rev_8_21_14_0_10_32_24]
MKKAWCATKIATKDGKEFYFGNKGQGTDWQYCGLDKVKSKLECGSVTGGLAIANFKSANDLCIQNHYDACVSASIINTYEFDPNSGSIGEEAFVADCNVDTYDAVFRNEKLKGLLQKVGKVSFDSGAYMEATCCKIK